MRRDGDGGLPDLRLYERLIDDGIAAADSRRIAVDHLTARRLAIVLASRPQQSEFSRGLLRFIRTGAVTRPLKVQLRNYARSGIHPNRAEVTRLYRYCIERGEDLGPVGPDFGSTCDQIDRADVTLAGLRDRVKHRRGLPEPTWPEVDGPQVVALARQDPHTQMVSLIMDATTANITMFAAAAYAGDREAHVREVKQMGDKLPEDSYGRRNRQAIAARETRIATRLRAVERAYKVAIEREEMAAPEAARTIDPVDRFADHEMELE
jgi:hypothetical protein